MTARPEGVKSVTLTEWSQKDAALSRILVSFEWSRLSWGPEAQRALATCDGLEGTASNCSPTGRIRTAGVIARCYSLM